MLFSVVLSGCSQDSFSCANGHSFETIPAVEATCTSIGLTEGLKCSICGYVQVEQQKIPMKNHSIEFIPAVESTCASAGLTEGLKCSACGYIQVEQKEIPKKKHTIVVDRQGVRPSLLTEGISDQSHCSVCGEIVSTYGWVPKATPRNGNGRYGFDHFETEPNKQKFYDALYIAAEEVVEDGIDYSPNEDGVYVISTLNLDDFGISIDEAVSVWVVFLCDNPAYYFIRQQFNSYGMEVILQIAEEYSTYEKRMMYDESIENMIYECGEFFNSDDLPLTKAVRIHDYIASRISYAYQSDGITPESSDTCVWTHNITGVSYLGRGVCESYAKTFQFLCNVYEVDSLIVTGESGEEEHAWNYICIDNEWYLVDVTFDDKHDWKEYYRYFGICSEEMDVVYQPSDNSCEGVDYLYPLPSLSEERLMLVELYKDDKSLGIYGTPDKAFEAMNESSSSYRIELYSYHGESGVETALASLFYNSKISDFPKVKKVSIDGKRWFPNSEDDSYYFTSRFNVESPILLNSDLCISDVQLYISSEVNLNSKTLFLSGSSQIDNSIGGCGEIYGLGGGLIVSEVESVSEISVPTEVSSVYANKGDITFRNNVSMDSLYGSIRLFGGLYCLEVPKASILNCFVSKYESSYSGIVVTNSFDVSIGNIYKQDDSDFLIATVFEDVLDYPSIRIKGESQSRIQIDICGYVYHEITDLNGNVISSTMKVANPLDLDKPILCSNNNIELSNFHIQVYNDDIHNPDEFVIYDSDYGLVFSPDLKKNGDYYVFHDSIVKYIGEDSEALLPHGYTVVRDSAFFNSKVESIIIPEGYKTIERGAFSSSKKLKKIELPDSIQSIGKGAFGHCASIEFLDINGSIREIPEGCFEGCQKLSTILIPNSVEKIENFSFENCSNLTNFYFKGTIAEWNSKNFGYLGFTIPVDVIHCTDGSISMKL